MARPASRFKQINGIEDDAEFLQKACDLMEDYSHRDEDHLEEHIFTKHGRNGSSKKTRVYLSHAHDWICWDHTGRLKSVMRGKKNRIDIAHIVRVEQGHEATTSKNLQRMKEISSTAAAKSSFSVITNDRSLDLDALNPDVASLWVRALNLLMQQTKGVNKGNRFFQYLNEQWNRADTDRSGTLTVDEVVKLMRQMNITKSRKTIKEMIAKFDENNDKSLNKEEFMEFMADLFSDRPEIYVIIKELKSFCGKDVSEKEVTAEDLVVFMNGTQKTARDPAVDKEWALEKIREVTRDADATTLTPLDFAMFLDDGENSAFDPIRAEPGVGCDIEEYMSQPMPHYFINSSHNTYLVGDQLKGLATTEQYTSVLQKGCRCVELDCWDGAPGVPEGNPGDQPIITHGHTLCTKILFRDVIKAIKAGSFGPPAWNPYPVILSIEMHCSHKFQEKMYEICRRELGPMLYLLPEDVDTAGMEYLPSPEQLKGKILVKGKRLKPQSALSAATSNQEEEEESSDSESDTEGMESIEINTKKNLKSTKDSKESKAEKKQKKAHAKINPNWSTLISLSAVHFKSFSTPGKGFEMSSFAEGKSKKLCESQREAFIDYNKKQLARIYPFGGRVDSSNLDPIAPWGAACQLVALNYQTSDIPMALNFGKFLENGNLGYVLKPPFMRGTGIKACAILLKVKVLSCQRLPNKGSSRDIVDPYVKVDLHGLGEDSKSFKTKTVNDNGFNPTFNKGEGQVFEFEILEREAAILRITVMDDDYGQSRDDFVGHCCIPVTCIRKGYRHVPLYDISNGMIKLAGVLCSFSLEGL